MDPVLIALIILFALGLVGFAYSRKVKNEGKEIGANFSTLATHLHGLPKMEGKELAKLYFTDDKIVAKVSKKKYELNYGQITAVAYANKSDLLVKDRSVIGRGIAGGILLGPVAAVIGGMSAVGKKKHIKGEFLIVNYTSSGSNEEKTVIFDLHKPLIAKKAEKIILDRRPQLVEPDQITL